MCWMEIESFRGIPASDKHVRDLKARQLRSKYFNKKYLFGPNSPASKEAQRQVKIVGFFQKLLLVISCVSQATMVAFTTSNEIEISTYMA